MHCIPGYPGISLISFFQLIKLKLRFGRICHGSSKNKSVFTSAIFSADSLTFFKTFNQGCKSFFQTFTIIASAFSVTRGNSLSRCSKIVSQSMSTDSCIFPTAVRATCFFRQTSSFSKIIEQAVNVKGIDKIYILLCYI